MSCCRHNHHRLNGNVDDSRETEVNDSAVDYYDEEDHDLEILHESLREDVKERLQAALKAGMYEAAASERKGGGDEPSPIAPGRPGGKAIPGGARRSLVHDISRVCVRTVYVVHIHRIRYTYTVHAGGAFE